MTIADDARQFWSAAKFWRSAPDRDRSVAVKIITHLTKSLAPSIASRAQSLMKEMQNGTDPKSPGDAG